MRLRILTILQLMLGTLIKSVLLVELVERQVRELKWEIWLFVSTMVLQPELTQLLEAIGM